MENAFENETRRAELSSVSPVRCVALRCADHDLRRTAPHRTCLGLRTANGGFQFGLLSERQLGKHVVELLLLQAALQLLQKTKQKKEKTKRRE